MMHIRIVHPGVTGWVELAKITKKTDDNLDFNWFVYILNNIHFQLIHNVHLHHTSGTQIKDFLTSISGLFRDKINFKIALKC